MRFLFILPILFIVSKTSGMCQLSTEASEFQIIMDVVDDATSITTEAMTIEIDSNVIPKRMFSKKLADLCPDVSSDILSENPLNKHPLLGKGGFGSVYQVAIDKKPRAVKIIKMSDIIREKLYKFLKDNDKEKINECVYSVLEGLLEDELFYDYEESEIGSKKYDDEEEESVDKLIVRYEDHRENLLPLNFKIFKTAQCDSIKDSHNIIKKVIEKEFLNLRQEIRLSKELSTFSQNKENPKYSSFSEYDGCIIDQNLDIYLIMEKLGPSFGDIRKVCPTSLNTHNVEQRLLFAMRLMYQVIVIHKKGYIHCDIKPDNVMFVNEDLENFHIMDFGLVRSDSPCKGGSPGFIPPEYPLKAENLADEKDAWDMGLELKHDSFSVGMTLLALELSQKSWEALKSKSQEMYLEKDKFKRFPIQVNFKALLKTSIENEFITRHGSDYQKSMDRRVMVERELSVIYDNLIMFDYHNRIPVVVGLYFAFQLYSSLINTGSEFKTIKRLIDSKDLMIELSNPKWTADVQKLLNVKKPNLNLPKSI